MINLSLLDTSDAHYSSLYATGVSNYSPEGGTV